MMKEKFVHLLNKYLLSARYVPGIVRGTGGHLGNKRDKIPALVEFNCISLQTSCDDKTNMHRNQLQDKSLYYILVN